MKYWGVQICFALIGVAIYYLSASSYAQNRCGCRWGCKSPPFIGSWFDIDFQHEKLTVDEADRCLVKCAETTRVGEK